MTRERIEPLPGGTGHDRPCEGCSETYRRTMIGAAIVMGIISTAGMVTVVLLAKAVG